MKTSKKLVILFLSIGCLLSCVHRDFDRDGFGDPKTLKWGTDIPGFVKNAADCDDTNPAINPNATEICDGVDNDCDGTIDSIEGCANAKHWRGEYQQLDHDAEIANSEAWTKLLEMEITLDSPTSLFFQSDGTYQMKNSGAGGSVFITIETNNKVEIVSNEAVIVWDGTARPEMHSFNVIGLKDVKEGDHKVALFASNIPGKFGMGAFVVRSGANLSVLAHSAVQAESRILESDTGPFIFDTKDFRNLDGRDTRPAPHTPFLRWTQQFTDGEAVVALASARIYHHNDGPSNKGDAMLGLYLDGRNTGNHVSTWTVNDFTWGVELQAPVFSHGLFEFGSPGLSGGSRMISFDASELPWRGEDGDNTVKYKVGSGSRMVVLRGGMPVHGAIQLVNTVDQTAEWGACTGSYGNTVNLASTQLQIPEGHDGVVFFTAKTRVQADSLCWFDDDTSCNWKGGVSTLGLRIDGEPVGSLGMQGLYGQRGYSSRTMSTSYLAAGHKALTPGAHQVDAWVRTDLIPESPAFTDPLPCFSQDLPLIWFD